MGNGREKVREKVTGGERKGRGSRRGEGTERKGGDFQGLVHTPCSKS